ncbi:MAG: DUF2520 domain-containing protein [Bacteroidetes bacterium]|nr:DUF2520 domain-containing protein [Bacteroidota bacterium]
MKSASGQKIVIIGCGNLAWHLAKTFAAQKKFDLYIYNHQPNKNLAAFKQHLKCKTQDSLKGIITDADFYFICVADKFISSASGKIKTASSDSLIVHASGSISIKEINQPNAGVFYPLQTFTKEDVIKWSEIPILIEANKKSDLLKLQHLAKTFTKTVREANSAEREKIHLAAVLVNNFTNALYTAADEFLSDQVKKQELNFNLLLPLIEQTALKLRRVSPLKAQTGPAKRNDKPVMKKHISLLKKNKQVKKLYKQLSELISDQQQKQDA